MRWTLREEDILVVIDEGGDTSENLSNQPINDPDD
jgi:hypothetical protein